MMFKKNSRPAFDSIVESSFELLQHNRRKSLRMNLAASQSESERRDSYNTLKYRLFASCAIEQVYYPVPECQPCPCCITCRGSVTRLV